MASSTASASVGMGDTIHSLTEEIDTLLEHYLGLLDQYTTLRGQLTSIQASIHQNIARANFTADRGIRYGADNYDQRMQAIRTCHCSVTSNSGSAVFSISKIPTFSPTKPKAEDREAEKEETENGEEDAEEEKKGDIRPKDPIRMFGILVPRALRDAQGNAINMVEVLVPELADLDAKMKDVEIEIRRKRKFKGKAELAEKKGIDVGREGVTV